MVKKSSNSLGFTISSAQQKLFIALAFGSVIVQVVTMLYFMVSQYGYNSNLSAYVFPLAQGLVWPATMFLIPFVLGLRRKMSGLARVFEATFLTVLVTLAATVIYPISYALQGYLIQTVPAFDAYVSFIIGSVGPMVVLGLIYLFAVIYYLRKR